MIRFIPLHEEIFRNTAVEPDLKAIEFQNESLSYRELDRLSSNLAFDLQQKGIVSGSLVGIYLTPSARLAISVLAVLKSGAAYVPLSTAFPEERIRYILSDAGARLVITEDPLPLPFPGDHIQWFIPDWAGLNVISRKNDPEPALIQASDLAYILYTSGSTGKPKGVMIEHRNLSYYIHWFCRHVVPATRVGLPLTSSFIFAAAVTQFYSTLLSGKTLHILDPLLIRQPGKLAQWYASHPGTGLYCVPTLWSEILDFLETDDAGPADRAAPSCVYLSGEAVSDVLLKRTFGLLPGLKLWNLYGPTEATANLTAGPLLPGEAAHIGRPLEGTSICIAGDDLQAVQPGETGELLASGEGIARGYLNLPELTESVFVNLKRNGTNTVRYYRSGDLVKEDGSGKLIYLGRKDQQVKIRGYRIELPEIEQALLLIPEVRHAVAKVVNDSRNGSRLCAYLSFRGDLSLSVNELRKILMRTLPDFMIPEVFVTLGNFPLLPNGKIDRKSLPLPGARRPELSYPVVSPVTAAEKQMLRIWEENLGIEGLGLEDNFFDLGGNSLKANALAMDLQARIGIPVQIKNIFDCPSPGKLLMRISSDSYISKVQRTEVSKTESLPADPLARFSGKPEPGNVMETSLSENQKALWFMQQAEPELSSYNIFYSITLSGTLDIVRLGQALNRICARHESLNTVFRLSKAQPEGIIQIQDRSIPEIFRAQPGSEYVQVSEAIEHARNAAKLPFKLETGPLYRFILYKTGENRHLLAFIVHHIVFDGFSFEVFLRDLSLFYDNANSLDNYKLTDESSSYAKFCREEQEYLNGPEYARDKGYWKEQLFQAPTFFEIPTDFIRPGLPSREGGQLRRLISPETRSGLRKLSDVHGTSMFMSCLAAFSVLLYRHSGRTDFLIGSPVANRLKKTFLSEIGYFVNTMLFRARFDPEITFSGLLGSVRELVLENLSHSKFPLSHMTEVLNTERIQGSNPLFQVMFAFHETPWEFSTVAGMGGRGSEEFFGRSKFDLFAEIFDSPGETEIVLTYSSGLFHAATMEILLDHFMQILEHVCIAPETRVSALNLISGKEFNSIVYEWNQTAVSPDVKGTINNVIALQAAKTPGLPALVSRKESITYAEMDRRTAIMCANLQLMGVGRGVPVGIHLDNSPNMLICILAVFRAGGIYIPLDPWYPEERLRYITEKTRIRFLVVDEEAQKESKKKLAEQVIPLSSLLNEVKGQVSGITPEASQPEDLAYIIFTSGSTGSPKGVMIRHDSLLNFLVWMKNELNVSDRDTFLSTTSINFDISFLELFTPLISGARLVLEKRSEIQAPEMIEDILNEMQVNTVQFVPSGLKALCDAGVLKRSRYLKNIISGGEKLSRVLQEQILKESVAGLINLYGPTEATVYMAYWHCLRDSSLRMVPIGHPISNALIYILDEHLKPLPAGIPGEVYIGGPVLAEGYFEDKLQTGSRFLPDPFTGDPDSRIYKTGDLGRFLWDGAVEFLGRIDQQVKLRGFRIEPGEIESVMLRFPGIKRVAVNALELKEEDVRLTAFIVPESGMTIQENELRDFLRLHLPAYMIPGSFIIAPSFPSLPNGKTDFKALLNLRPGAPVIPEFLHRRLNETEIALSAIWKEILDHESFSPQDNFFEVGGHSLLLVRMKDLIAGKLKTEVSIVDLFHYPSIRSLAAFLRKDKPDTAMDDIAKRAAMRNRNIRQQIMKRIFPDNNQS